MEFSRQEYGSGEPFPSLGDLPDSLQARILEGEPFPSPEDLPDPGVEPRSPALPADSLLSEPPGNPNNRRTTAKQPNHRTESASKLPRCGRPLGATFTTPS